MSLGHGVLLVAILKTSSASKNPVPGQQVLFPEASVFAFDLKKVNEWQFNDHDSNNGRDRKWPRAVTTNRTRQPSGQARLMSGSDQRNECWNAA
jgi:hypothetical protein